MKLKIICLFATMLLGGMSLMPQALAEARNIYVGDIITLEIASAEGEIKKTGDVPAVLSEENLRQIFKDFEIVELEQSAGGYLLSLRSFNVGEHRVRLGAQEIIIAVASTLQEMPQEDIFEGDIALREPGFFLPLRYLLYGALATCALAAGYVMARKFFRRSQTSLSPVQIFQRRSAAIAIEDENYLAALTLYFKEYLASLQQRRISGMTSAELLREVQLLPLDEAVFYEIRQWLNECDRFKFAGIAVTAEDKRQHYRRLLEIVQRMEGCHDTVR